MLKEFCEVCDGSNDNLIGMCFKNGKPLVTFPRGYRLSEKDEEIRKDIVHLLLILHKFNDAMEGQGKETNEGDTLTFPILSYQYIIYDYLKNGYYKEKSVEYMKDKRGKINWKQTIQMMKPIISDQNIIYLDFMTKKRISEGNMITKIHEYCVYECFSKLGWLYTSSSFMPNKPSIKFNKKMFLFVLKEALKNTFNNNKKKLLNSMVKIISQANEKAEFPELSYGVKKFDRIWEKIIDYVYGIENKEDYFPHSYYTIIENGEYIQNNPLYPDTIMKNNNKIYILDAKYYKYGITKNTDHLPPTSSVHKQITYGEYVYTKNKAKINDVFNSFILPYHSKFQNKFIDFVAVATGDWIAYNASTPAYKYIIVLLLDTKHIMDTYIRLNKDEIEKMSNIIEESLYKYLSNFKPNHKN